MKYRTKLIRAVAVAITNPSGENDAMACIVTGKKACRKRNFLKIGMYLMLKYRIIMQTIKLINLAKYAVLSRERLKSRPSQMPTT